MGSSLRYHYSWRLSFIQNIITFLLALNFTLKIFLYYGLDEDHHKLFIQSTSGQFFALFLRMDNVSHDIKFAFYSNVLILCSTTRNVYLTQEMKS